MNPTISSEIDLNKMDLKISILIFHNAVRSESRIRLEFEYENENENGPL